MKSRSQIISLITGKGLALIATMLMPMILTRFLNMQDYGTYGQFYTVLLFLVGISTMGIHTSLYYFFNIKEGKDQKKLILQSLIILLLMAVVIVFILKIPIINENILEKSGLSKYFIYLVLALLFSIPVEMIQPLYILHNDKKMSLMYPFFLVILKTICIISFTLYNNNIDSVLKGVILASFITFSFLCYYIIIKIKRIQIEFDYSLIKEQIVYSFPFGLAVMLKLFSLRFDKIVSLSVLTSTQYAIYIIAYYGVPGINEVFDSLAQVYTIKITHLYKENNIAEIVENYRNLIVKTLSYTLPLVLIVCLYADSIISLLFSKKYLPATPYFRIYLICVVLTALGAGLILRATNNTKSTLRIYFISSIVTMPVTYILVCNFSIGGAVTGSVIGLIIPIALIIRSEMKVLNTTIFNHFDWKKIFLIFSISILVYVPFLLLKIYFGTTVIITALLGIIYLILVFLFQIKYDVFIIEHDEFLEKKMLFINKLKRIIK
ncbi:oligosaccharide flippase family protein [Flavobacterium sp. PS2]|uniref:oligosaccharide flippase family protein n=1 Tax=Flavobacterium sp. PS2 TaxID=3384157 RepID=UPI00390CA7CC